MESQKEPERKFKFVSYLCSQCSVKRDLFVDEQKHLSRRELNLNGLAPYIDIHENYKKPEIPEHGMQIFVDFNFHVRSNYPMTKTASPPKSSIPGLPAPVVAINQIKMHYKSTSWNSLNLASQSHNIGYFIINPDPTIVPGDGVIANFDSALKSVSLKVNYRISVLSKEFIMMSHKWLFLLAKWVENTASLNMQILPRLLVFIDKNVARSPDDADELSMSILIDSSASIKLEHKIDNVKPIKHSISLLVQQWKKFKFSDTVLALNIPIYEFMLSVLNSGKFVEIVEILEIVKTVDEHIKNQFIDTFIIIFFDLFRDNNLEYMVSYLL
ncbi:MAG: hypothetical protein GPJ54_08255 [Candidatus Heimdallarchaeota archaeon]|nr:hypothetical protein [Candidatus Heimdallarchaeota archaeon]